jgi:hypothetical protein
MISEEKLRLRRQLRRIIRENVSQNTQPGEIASRDFLELPELLRKKFPSIGEESVGIRSNFERFQLGSVNQRGRFMTAEFFVGNGEIAWGASPTEITDTQKATLVSFINSWAEKFGSYLARVAWRSNGNVYSMILGFAKLEKDQLEEMPETVYHITSIENVDAILAKGLLPRHPYSLETEYQKHSDTVGQRAYPARVYFFVDKTTAIDRAQKDANANLIVSFEKEVLNSENDHSELIVKSEAIVVLSINASSISSANIDLDFQDKIAGFTTAPIPKTALSVEEIIRPNLSASAVANRYYSWREASNKDINGMQKKLADFAKKHRVKL